MPRDFRKYRMNRYLCLCMEDVAQLFGRRFLLYDYSHRRGWWKTIVLLRLSWGFCRDKCFEVPRICRHTVIIVTSLVMNVRKENVFKDARRWQHGFPSDGAVTHVIKLVRESGDEPIGRIAAMARAREFYGPRREGIRCVSSDSTNLGLLRTIKKYEFPQKSRKIK